MSRNLFPIRSLRPVALGLVVFAILIMSLPDAAWAVTFRHRPSDAGNSGVFIDPVPSWDFASREVINPGILDSVWVDRAQFLGLTSFEETIGDLDVFVEIDHDVTGDVVIMLSRYPLVYGPDASNIDIPHGFNGSGPGIAYIARTLEPVPADPPTSGSTRMTVTMPYGTNDSEQIPFGFFLMLGYNTEKTVVYPETATGGDFGSLTYYPVISNAGAFEGYAFAAGPNYKIRRLDDFLLFSVNFDGEIPELGNPPDYMSLPEYRPLLGYAQPTSVVLKNPVPCDTKDIFVAFDDQAGIVPDQSVQDPDDNVLFFADRACDLLAPGFAGRLVPTRLNYLGGRYPVGYSDFFGHGSSLGADLDGDGFEDDLDIAIRDGATIPLGINSTFVETEGLWILRAFDYDRNGMSPGTIKEWGLTFEDEESDLAPRHDVDGYNGNDLLTISDWLESSLFLIGLNWVNQMDMATGTVRDGDAASALSEFNRLDSSPKSSFGDGLVTIADWVQAGRYSENEAGFDDEVNELGPIRNDDRIVRVDNVILNRGYTQEVSIRMYSKGVEHEVGLTLEFDPNKLQFVNAIRGRDVPPDWEFVLKNETDAVSGKIGVQVGLLPANPDPPVNLNTFPGGDVEIARITFRATDGIGTVGTPLTFSDSIFSRAVRDITGTRIYAVFANAAATLVDPNADQPIVRFNNAVLERGESGDAYLLLDSVGQENAMGFTVVYDPALLTLNSIEKGSDVPTNAILLTNPFFPSMATGEVQFLLGLQPGETFPEGTVNLAKFNFTAAAGTDTVPSVIRFTPLYDAREIVDIEADRLISRFNDSIVTLTTGGDTCFYSLDRPNQQVSPDGGTFALILDTTPDYLSCPWNASSSDAWITLSAPTSGNGDAVLSYTVAPNNGPARSGQITVGDQIHTISQTGGGQFFFGFDTDDEGWMFDSQAPFTPAGHAYNGGAGQLDLTTVNNTDTFGFWYSPIIPLDEAVPSNNVFRATFALNTTTSPQSIVPKFRVRSATVDFQQSDVLDMTSNLNGALAPTNLNREFYHYFTLPSGQDSFRLAFDILGFDPNDAAVSTIGLDFVEIEQLTSGNLGTRRSELLLDFSGNPNSWNFGGYPTLLTPQFSVNDRGLVIVSGLSAGETPAAFYFGAWHHLTDVQLEGNRLYRAAFTVEADVAEADKADLPGFRLRLNDDSFESSAYVNVESIDSTSRLPYAGNPVTYHVYFLAPPELDGNYLYAAFDYMLNPASNNDPTIPIVLNSLDIVSYGS
ncbi:hypothetical protein KQI84_07220 [bacterium]|nr:hypothetical protein [bacterium]